MSNECLAQLHQRTFLSPKNADERFHTFSLEPLTQMMHLPTFDYLCRRPDRQKIVTYMIDKVLFELITDSAKTTPISEEHNVHTFNLLRNVFQQFSATAISKLKETQEFTTIIDINAMTNAAILFGKALCLSHQRKQTLNSIDFQELFEEQRQIERGDAGTNDVMSDGNTDTPITRYLQQIVEGQPIPA